MSWAHVERLTVAALEASLCRKRVIPPVPPAGHPAMTAFDALSSTRGWHDGRPAPIAWAEIDAWARLQPQQPHPRTLAIVRAMDRAFLEWAAEKRENAR